MKSILTLNQVIEQNISLLESEFYVCFLTKGQYSKIGSWITVNGFSHWSLYAKNDGTLYTKSGVETIFNINTQI